MFSHVFAKRKHVAVIKPHDTIRLIPQFRSVVVPAAGAPYSHRAIKTACRLASGMDDTEIRLVYLIEVPRAFALTANMPGEEALAESVLSEGANIVRGYGCNISVEVQRGRDLEEILLRYVTQHDTSLLVLGSRPDGVRGIPLSLARAVYDRSPCPVVLDYIAGETSASTSASSLSTVADLPSIDSGGEPAAPPSAS